MGRDLVLGQRQIPELARGAHTLIMGASRRGKSGSLSLSWRADVLRGAIGCTMVDIPGELARREYEWMSNPRNGVSDRKVHYCNPCHPHITFGLNVLHVDKPDQQSCHKAAMRWVSCVENIWGVPAEQQPRVTKLNYITGLVLARAQLPITERPALLKQGERAVYDQLIESYEYSPARQELAEVVQLSDRMRRDYLDAIYSRDLHTFGDPNVRLVVGQTKGLRPREIMDNREFVLVDLGGLHSKDASLLATIINSLYYDDAKERPPSRSSGHRMYLDEGESQLTEQIARGYDQTAKHGLSYVIALQRMEQARKSEFIFDALMTNSAVKIVFGGLPPDAAEYLAKFLYAGYLNYAQWKHGTERPVLVGHDTITLKNWSKATHKASHSSHTDSITDSESDTHADSDSYGSSSGTSGGSGTNSGLSLGTTGDNWYWSMLPVGSMFNLPSDVAISSGENSFSGFSEGSFQQHASSDAHTTSRAESAADSHGESRGTSKSEGASEALRARLEWLPSQTFSLAEIYDRLAGEIMHLPRREAIISVEGAPPFRERTREFEPGYHAEEFRVPMLEAFTEKCLRTSGVMLTVAEADRRIAARALELQGATQQFDDALEAATATKGKPLPPKTIEGTVVDSESGE